MILSADEVKTCLIWTINPYLNQYDMHINDMTLKLNQKLMIETHIEYKSNIMHIQGKCELLYKNNDIIFRNIEGQIDYLFISMNLIQVLQQYIHSTNIKIIDNDFYYHKALPIKNFILKDEHLYLNLVEM
ncbi:MAG: hypothetical protein LUG60_05970 [Erysipelotrichaceae bacterium]|nr:hypothetical protein [Erysipelotrichaceae bacterium]